MRLEPLTLLGQAPLGPYLKLTLRWPETWPTPTPGQAVRLADGRRLWPMREVQDGRLELLTDGTRPLDALTSATLEGVPLVTPQGPALLIGQGLGLAPLIHLCDRLRHARPEGMLVLYEVPEPLPFRPRPSRFLIEGLPAGVIAAIPLLEDWGMPSRLADAMGRPGMFEGGVEELLATLPSRLRSETLAMGEGAFIERFSLPSSSALQVA